MEKVHHFSNSPTFLLLLLQYVKDTKLRRIHQRSSMRINPAAYYRALENIIDNSRFNTTIFTGEGEIILKNAFQTQSFEMNTLSNKISFEEL